MTPALTAARAAIQSADAILITAGAGMGVDSGLPDFRGRRGFWRAYPAVAARGLRFEQMADPRWFEREPALAWAFYGHRLHLYRSTRPHAGFRRLLALALDKPAGYAVFSSNVDGHFQRAGYDEQRVLECHGSIHHLQCSKPCGTRIWSAEALDIEVDQDRFQAIGPLPICPACGAVARPNILMFGDFAWVATRTAAQQRRLESWLEALRRRRAHCVIVEIGAGTAVPTVRMTGERIAATHHARLIRINPRDDAVPAGPHLSIRMSGLEAIELLLED